MSDAGVAGEATAGDGGLNASGGEGAGTAAGGGAAGNAGSGSAGEYAVAKFCNTLFFSLEETTMILEVGEGADRVTFSAVTDTCSPADGDACRAIPAGENVRVQLTDATDLNAPLEISWLLIEPGTEVVFFTSITNQSEPIWEGTLLDDSLTCEEFSFGDL